MRRRHRLLEATPVAWRLRVLAWASLTACSSNVAEPQGAAGGSVTEAAAPDSAQPTAGAAATLAACNPLADWEHHIVLENPLLVARTSTGNVVTVTRLDAGYVVWVSSGNVLEPYGVTATGESNGYLSLVVETRAAPGGSFVLTLNSATAPTQALLGAESLAAGVRLSGLAAMDTSASVELEILPSAALDDFQPARLYRAPARVEGRYAMDERSELVIVGPGFLRDVRDLRVFYGDPERLREQPIADVIQTYDDYSPELELSLELASGEVILRLFGLYPNDDGRHMGGFGVARMGEDEHVLTALPRTPLSVTGLRFECAAAGGARWTLTNAPPLHEPVASCPPELSGRVLPARRYAGDDTFHCVALSPGLRSAPDDLTLEAEFSAIVAEIGAGVPPGSDCVADARAALDRYPDLSLMWTRVEREDQRATIVLRAPRGRMPFALGDELEVSYGAYARRGEAMTLRRPSGELLFWYGRAVDVPSLDTPVELSLAEGPEQCATSHGCFYSSQYALRATLASEVAIVEYGEQTEKAGFLLIHGGVEVPTAPVPGCDDGLAASASAELWALTASAP